MSKICVSCEKNKFPSTSTDSYVIIYTQVLYIKLHSVIFNQSIR